jgi:hypothetical protein
MTKIDTVPGSMKETLEIQGRIKKKKKIKGNEKGRLGQVPPCLLIKFLFNLWVGFLCLFL